MGTSNKNNTKQNSTNKSNKKRIVRKRATDNPRKVSVKVEYERKRRYKKGKKSINRNVSNDLEGLISSFAYEDIASGESDTVEIELDNSDMRFLTSWSPHKGDKIKADIQVRNWSTKGGNYSICCGKFCIDQVQFEGPELNCTIGATAIPENNAFHCTTRTKTWKSITIKEIARQMAARYHMNFKYDAENIRIKELEQNEETDSSFLSSLAENNGLGIKIFFGSIIIFNKEKYEKKKIVATLHKNDLLSWSYQDSLIGYYTGATIKYTQKIKDAKDKTHKVKVGGGKRLYKCNNNVDSEAEAKRIACAEVNKENEKCCMLSCTIMAKRLYAGCTVKLEEMGAVNGKYFIDKVVHNISANGVYTQQIEMHRIRNRIHA